MDLPAKSYRLAGGLVYCEACELAAYRFIFLPAIVTTFFQLLSVFAAVVAFGESVVELISSWSPIATRGGDIVAERSLFLLLLVLF